MGPATVTTTTSASGTAGGSQYNNTTSTSSSSNNNNSNNIKVKQLLSLFAAVFSKHSDFLLTPKTGIRMMTDSIQYSGMETLPQDRTDLGIRGLLPAGHLPLEVNVERCMEQVRSKSSDLEKYIYLQSIQDVSENLYFAILTKYTEEVMPLVYTPTVGEACQKYSKIYSGAPRGLYLSLNDKGMIRTILDNWKTSKVTTIVVTDGERILGLGDQGVNGMGIPIGKLALYTALAGIDPATVLPVHIDVGTNNEDNLNDPYYLGLKQKRVRGQQYDELIAEFFHAVQDKYGMDVLVQFEDFGNHNAFRLLKEWQDKACTFNDDIQGTAAVALAGLMATERVTGKQLKDQTFLFSGAGEAGVGIAELIALTISQEGGISLEEARKNIFMVDSKGLITKSRPGKLQDHKKDYAHDVENCDNLLEAVNRLKPSSLIGVSAIPNTFTQEIVEKMAELNDAPIIFALSNPTSKAECTAKQAYEWSNGKVIFCSGSPFKPVELDDGRRFVPGQGNNAYVFPGIGLGVLAAGSNRITDQDMLVAARTLAELVSEEQLKTGCMYPPFSRIREVSKHIATQVALKAHEEGIATNEKPSDMEAYVESIMYDPWKNPDPLRSKL